MIELLTDQEIISFEYQRRELVQKRLGRRCTQDELRGLHELDRKLSGRDIGGAFFSEFARLQEENKKLREERDKLVERVKKAFPALDSVCAYFLHLEEHAQMVGVSLDRESAEKVKLFFEAHQTLKDIGEV